jgi:hypothetical protein
LEEIATFTGNRLIPHPYNNFIMKNVLLPVFVFLFGLFFSHAQADGPQGERLTWKYEKNWDTKEVLTSKNLPSESLVFLKNNKGLEFKDQIAIYSPVFLSSDLEDLPLQQRDWIPIQDRVFLIRNTSR